MQILRSSSKRLQISTVSQGSEQKTE
jgi:hypothetical protein